MEKKRRKLKKYFPPQKAFEWNLFAFVQRNFVRGLKYTRLYMILPLSNYLHSQWTFSQRTFLCVSLLNELYQIQCIQFQVHWPLLLCFRLFDIWSKKFSVTVCNFLCKHIKSDSIFSKGHVKQISFLIKVEML